MDEWHKALVLVLRKLGVVEILISPADMAEIQAIKKAGDQPCAICIQLDDGVHIRLTTQEEAGQLAKVGSISG